MQQPVKVILAINIYIFPYLYDYIKNGFNDLGKIVVCVSNHKIHSLTFLRIGAYNILYDPYCCRSYEHISWQKKHTYNLFMFSFKDRMLFNFEISASPVYIFNFLLDEYKIFTVNHLWNMILIEFVVL